MNYYEHHLGDYAKDTTSLSMLEEGAYRRLLDAYYAKEKPLPCEESKVFKLARANSKQEKIAVRSVLDEFFSLKSDGFHHKRCDEEIERYKLSQEDSEDKRENEKERQKRHRSERKEMFSTLRERGIVPPWDTSTTTLRALIDGQSVTPPVTKTETPVTPPVTRTATANQSPDTRHQTPVIKTKHVAFAPPDWIPTELWNSYLSTRKKKRASIEPETLALVVKQLAAFKASGHDPVEIIRTSVMSGWAGVFEPKGKPQQGAPPSKQAALELRNAEAGRKAKELIFGVENASP